MRLLLAIFAALLLTLPVFADEAETGTKSKPVRQLHTEVDGVKWAFTALLQYPPERQSYMRFVYLPPWADSEWIGVMDFAMNASVSQSRRLYRGDVHADGWLIAYDLSLYASGPKLDRLVKQWDELAIDDPYFHVPSINVVKSDDVIVVHEYSDDDPIWLTIDGNAVESTAAEVAKLVQQGEDPRIMSHDQKSGWVSASELGFARQSGPIATNKEKQQVALLAPHLDAALAEHATDPTQDARIDVLLTQLTKSTGGIYRADWLLEQLLTSVRGHYPEFRQIDFDARDGKLSPLQTRLKQFGFDVDRSVDSGGEKGALLLISEVTGKSRIVLATYGLSSRIPLVTTYDYKDSTTRPDKQFIRNLLEFDSLHDATEVFLPLPNGLLEFLLTDADGNFQRTAPPDVVADYNKPDGHTHELEMGMSCVLCHHGNDGYNTASNDMELLLNADVDFFGEDLTIARKGGKRTLTANELVDIIAARYGERIDAPDGVLGRARRDYSRAVAELTDYETSADGASVAARVGTKIKEIYHGYRYERIDAAKACLELGVDVVDQDPNHTLASIVPAPIDGEPEDIVVALLRNGAVIKRDDVEAIFGEMARRAVLAQPFIKGKSNEP